MALDSSGLPPADADPSADTPPADDGTQAGDTPTPQQPVDWEARYKAAQADLTRKAMKAAQLERELADARAVAEPETDDEEGEAQPASRSRGRSSAEAEALRGRLAEMERQVASSVHGDDVVGAYDQWVDVWNGTETESDRITALLAFADIVRGTPQAPAPAPAATTRAEALTPRVDQNRSDATPQDPIDPKRYEGGANGGISAWLQERMGVSRGR